MAKKKTVQPAKTAAAYLRPHVKKVLLEAAKLPGQPYLTAFQILDKLPPRLLKLVIKVHEVEGGKKAYRRYPASVAIKNAAFWLTKDIIYISTHGLTFTVNGKTIVPSSDKKIAAYRLLPVKKKAAKKPKMAATKPAVE